VPEQNKKLAGFEALYKIDQEKRSQKSAATGKQSEETPNTSHTEATNQKESKNTSNKVIKSESNITDLPGIEFFEPTTFKADRRKVLALKRLALDTTPARKLQDLFDEALADILVKYKRDIE
jgi:FtsZ-interacting cell division protein YlmF